MFELKDSAKNFFDGKNYLEAIFAKLDICELIYENNGGSTELISMLKNEDELLYMVYLFRRYYNSKSHSSYLGFYPKIENEDLFNYLDKLMITSDESTKEILNKLREAVLNGEEYCSECCGRGVDINNFVCDECDGTGIVYPKDQRENDRQWNKIKDKALANVRQACKYYFESDSQTIEEIFAVLKFVKIK